jgi:hypothetical protein
MKKIKQSLLVVLAVIINLQPSITKAEYSFNGYSPCRYRSQIVQISGFKYICQKRYSPNGVTGAPGFVLVKITSVKIQKKPEINVPKATTSTISAATTTTSTSTSTSTTVLQKKFLISSNFEVIDTSHIKISWNQIPDVREYRICIDNQCVGADSQKIWLTISPTLNSIIVDLSRGQTRRYFVHALLFPSATQFDELDTRTCCYGTKWANSNWLQATNQ